MLVNSESEFCFNLWKALCSEETRGSMRVVLVTFYSDVDKCVTVMRV